MFLGDTRNEISGQVYESGSKPLASKPSPPLWKWVWLVQSTNMHHPSVAFNCPESLSSVAFNCQGSLRKV